MADYFALVAQAAQFYRDQLKASPRAIRYLKRRGLSGEIAARFGIGYAPAGWHGLRGIFPDYNGQAVVDAGLVAVGDKGRRYDRFRDRIMFPIFDESGRIVGFGGRRIEEGDGPKYLNSPETAHFCKGSLLFGLPQARPAIDAAGTVVVVEGYMDAMALAQYGVENVVATLGTATTPRHLAKLLAVARRIVFCFDGDDAGREAARRTLGILAPVIGTDPDGSLPVSFMFLPPEHDPDSFVRELGVDAFRALTDKAVPLDAFMLTTLLDGHEWATCEGRARLAHCAMIEIRKVADPCLQERLTEVIAEAVQFTPEQLWTCG